MAATTARGQRVERESRYSEEYRDWLRMMLLIRRFEERAGEAYSVGQIGGFCHLYVGQEAVAVGGISALRADDYVISAYREHGQALARGMSGWFAHEARARWFNRIAGALFGALGIGVLRLRNSVG